MTDDETRRLIREKEDYATLKRSRPDLHALAVQLATAIMLNNNLSLHVGAEIEASIVWLLMRVLRMLPRPGGEAVSDMTDSQNMTVKVDTHICFACPCLLLKASQLDDLCCILTRENLAKVLWLTPNGDSTDSIHVPWEDVRDGKIAETCYGLADALLVLPEVRAVVGE